MSNSSAARTRRFFVGFNLLATGAGALVAMPAGAAIGESVTETIVITATRTPTALRDLAVPVRVIERAQIERRMASDAAELLAAEPGIEVARNGGPGQATSLFLRGAESNHATVLVDGLRINPGTIGGAAVQNVSPELLERIEVVKGARSTLYGSDAIGGVINLITRRGGARGLGVYAASGRYGEQVLSLDGGLALTERAALSGSAAWRDSDGFAPLADDSRARGHRNASSALRLDVEVSEAMQLGARAWRASGNTEYLGYDNSFSFGPLDQDFLNQAYALTLDWRGAQQALNLSASRMRDGLWQRQTPDHALTDREVLDAQWSRKWGEVHRLLLGAMHSEERSRSLSFGTGYAAARRSSLWFAQDQWDVQRGHLLLAAGHTEDSAFGAHRTWNAEYVLPIGAGWRLHSALGSGYHAPDSTDLYGFGGNRELKPERSQQAELGARWQSPGSGTQQYFSFSAFDNRIRDLVVLELIDPQNFVFRNANVEHAHVRGAEFEYGLKQDDWTLDLTLTVQNPRNVSADARLLRRARVAGSARLWRQIGRVSLGAAFNHSGEREDAAFPANVTLPAYQLASFSVIYAHDAQWSLAARLDNAFDQHYQLINGYRTPRRALTVSTRYRFR